MNWQTIAQYVIARLKESSTWTGIIKVATGITGLSLSQTQTTALISLGIAVAGAVSVFLPDFMGKKVAIRLPDGSTVHGEHTTEKPDVVVTGEEFHGLK